MDEEAEKLMNKNNMQAVGDEIKSRPAMKQKVGDSLKPVTDLLDSFQRTKLRQCPFKVTDVVTQSEMDRMFEEINIVDSSLQQDSLRMRDLVLIAVTDGSTSHTMMGVCVATHAIIVLLEGLQ